jgi:hypothetical protein
MLWRNRPRSPVARMVCVGRTLTGAKGPSYSIRLRPDQHPPYPRPISMDYQSIIPVLCRHDWQRLSRPWCAFFPPWLLLCPAPVRTPALKREQMDEGPRSGTTGGKASNP